MKSNQPKHVDIVIQKISEKVRDFENPVSSAIGDRTRDPFLVLISCVLSLRTTDKTMGPACARLFDLADNPKDMVKLSQKKIEKAIFPVGFYPTKAKWIRQICALLNKEYNGVVPKDEEELLKFPGIGRKCMGIVQVYGHHDFNFIPVDTHVHKIANRLGWIKTKTPEQSELALMRVMPKKHWKVVNDILVGYGQNICVPISPFCSKCPVEKYCPKIGVTSTR